MLDLSNYTYKGYVESYYGNNVTLAAGTYLINARIMTTKYPVTIGNAIITLNDGEWAKIKITSSSRM